jgi:hypothetical protein
VRINQPAVRNSSIDRLASAWYTVKCYVALYAS